MDKDDLTFMFERSIINILDQKERGIEGIEKINFKVMRWK
jgi:hypothetical protein